MTLAISFRTSDADRREALFASLLERYGGAIRRLAGVYEADPALAEDLSQEIFLALWRALPSFREESSSTTYLFRIAHNRALRHVARQLARRSLTEPAGEEADNAHASGPSPETRVIDDETRQRLRSAVRGLRESLRQVVVLRLEGLSAEEIGEVLGLTANNVMVRLHRARGELRGRLLEGVQTKDQGQDSQGRLP